MQEPARSASSPAPAGSMRSLPLGAAAIVVVLGVLPFARDASPVWQVLGPLVATVLAARAAVLVWRRAFSTDPRHLTATG